MNEGEIILEISRTHKAYAGIMPQSTYSSIMIRYKHGLLKPATIAKFLCDMGYEKVGDSWQMKQYNKKVA